MRDVGEMGQKELEQWAAQAGMVANPVRRDRSGWDVLLETPFASEFRLPLDRGGHPVQCLIQVKSTDARPGRWSVKLANWLRLIRSPLPAFFLVMEFDREPHCQQAYLIHVDKTLIEAVLRRAREVSVTSPGLPPHKSVFSFKYDREALLQSPDGEGLLAALQHHVPNSADYALEKQRLVSTIGYGSGGNLVEVELEFVPDDPTRGVQDLMIDWALGVNKNLLVRPGAKVYDQRFGIRYPEPISTIETTGKMEAQPTGRGLVRLRTLDGSQERTLEVVVYGSGVLSGYIPDDKHIIRIASTYLDLFVPLSDTSRWQSVTRVPTGDALLPLMELRQLSDLVLLFSEAAMGGGLDVEARLEGRPLTGRMEFSAGPPQELLALGQAVRSMLRIARQIGIPASTLTCINEVYGQRQTVAALDSFVRGENLSGTFKFTTSAQIEMTRICFPIVLFARIGEHVISFAAGQIGVAKPTGVLEDECYEYVFTTSEVRVLECTAYKSNTLPLLTPLGQLERVANASTDVPALRWWED